MSDRTSAYASAVVALAQGEGVLDTVETELMTVARAVDGNAELREHLTDIQAPVHQRLRFVETETLSAAHPVTRSALAMIIAADRAGDLASIARAVGETAAAGRDRELAEVYVAAPLDDERTEQLRQALERATGRSLDLRVVVDESVVGGVRARIGDTVIDGSLAKRLEDVRTRVIG